MTATLVTGASAQAREAAIAAAIAAASSDVATAVILEGLAPGRSPLESLSADVLARVRSERIAPGCLCCTGNLVLRVTLNRLLRRRPESLYIGVARGEHLDQLRSWLRSEPYDQLLRLTDDLRA